MNVGEVLAEWRRNPLRFVHEAIGAKPTNQQEAALIILGELYDAKMKVAHHAMLSEREAEYSKKIGISIRSGHGTGKDAFVSWVYLWLLVCFPGPRGLVTAPTQHQLRDILWPEIKTWIRRSHGKLGEVLQVQSDKIYRASGRDRDEAFIVSRTAQTSGSADEQAETLAGFHSNYLISVVDEASGVPDGVFKPLEGAQTGLFNIGILIGNPTKSSGFFFDTHHESRKYWIPLHWNCEESNLDEITGLNTMAGFVERCREKYGRDSNWYRVRVLGEFPVAEPDALIPLELILAARGREVVEAEEQQLVLGVDVARMGDDLSVICPRRGMIVEPLLVYRKMDTMELTGFVMGAMADLEPRAVCIDSIGVGAGVVDRLRELKKGVIGVNVSEAASSGDRFNRLRDELWWRVRERFESRRVQIPNDDELIGELASIKYEVQSSGKIKIESKAERRKRNVASPNRADALMLTEYMRDSHYRERPKDPYELFLEGQARNRSWMTV